MRVDQRQTALGFGFCRGFICFVILCLVPLLETAQAQTGSSAIIVRSIQVDGNQRVERETVLSYMAIRPGDPYQESQVDQSLKTLFATGLFSDVRIQLSGVDLVVTVSENPIINRVIFEGNQRLNDDRLREEVEVRPRA
ncbi:MAG: POTRA domain-containing protein, partial [Pseudomonadota bacterium]